MLLPGRSRIVCLAYFFNPISRSRSSKYSPAVASSYTFEMFFIDAAFEARQAHAASADAGKTEWNTAKYPTVPAAD